MTVKAAHRQFKVRVILFKEIKLLELIKGAMPQITPVKTWKNRQIFVTHFVQKFQLSNFFEKI